MVAVDTNMLVYAHRTDTEWHSQALSCLLALAESGDSWGIPWPCVHEFISVVTHPRIFDPPSTPDQAIGAIHAWMQSPGLVLLHEGPGYMAKLARLCRRGQVTGPMVHDARIAAICLNTGVSALWTCDHNFGRFPDLHTVNPMLH